MFEEELFLEEAVEADFLIAGGGGGGGSAVIGSTGQGGPGGAGRLLLGVVRLLVGSYPIVVGAGASARPAGSNNGLNGGASSAFGFNLPGGGGGGTPTQNGRDGGSGGGGGSTDSGGGTVGGAAVPGTPVAGSGFAGGGGAFGGTRGLGGGAGGPANAFVDPGPGVVSSISGAPVEYCKGGPAGPQPTTPGSGGRSSHGSGTATGSPGLDGVVIVAYRGPPRGTGGAITSAGGKTIHTFTTNGTLVLVG